MFADSVALSPGFLSDLDNCEMLYSYSPPDPPSHAPRFSVCSSSRSDASFLQTPDSAPISHLPALCPVSPLQQYCSGMETQSATISDTAQLPFGNWQWDCRDSPSPQFALASWEKWLSTEYIPIYYRAAHFQDVVWKIKWENACLPSNLLKSTLV